MDKNNVNNKNYTTEEIREYGQHRLNRVNHNQFNINEFDVSSIRMYFSSFKETSTRFLIASSIIEVIVSMLILNVNSFNQHGELLRNLTSFAIFFGSIIVCAIGLLLIFPLFLCQTIKSVMGWSLVFMTIGNFFTFTALGLSLYFWLKKSVKFGLQAAILCGTSTISLFTGSLSLLLMSKKNLKIVEQTLVEQLNMGK